MIFAILFSNLVCMLGLKCFANRAQRRAELQVWHPHKQNPVVDAMLRKTAGEIHNPRRRWVADLFKRRVRSFVNSEAFSLATDAVFNQDSGVFKTGRSARKLIRYPNKKSSFDTQPDSVCTIH